MSLGKSKETIVLNHHISSAGIKVDPSAKIKVIMDIPTPRSQKEVRIFLGHVVIIGDSLKILRRLQHQCSNCLLKTLILYGTHNAKMPSRT
jgi:hypothetical protein